jgi:hypothetical protein
MNQKQKPKHLHDSSWSKHWDNIDWMLYAKVRLRKAYPDTLMRYHLPHLAKVIEDRHNLDKHDK